MNDTVFGHFPYDSGFRAETHINFLNSHKILKIELAQIIFIGLLFLILQSTSLSDLLAVLMVFLPYVQMPDIQYDHLLPKLLTWIESY